MSVPANAMRTVWVPSVKKYRSYTYAIGYAEGMGEAPGARIATGGGAPYPHDPLSGGGGGATYPQRFPRPRWGGGAPAPPPRRARTPCPFLRRPGARPS